jgi:hypothetical protein
VCAPRGESLCFGYTLLYHYAGIILPLYHLYRYTLPNYTVLGCLNCLQWGRGFCYLAFKALLATVHDLRQPIRKGRDWGCTSCDGLHLQLDCKTFARRRNMVAGHFQCIFRARHACICVIEFSPACFFCVFHPDFSSFSGLEGTGPLRTRGTEKTLPFHLRVSRLH